MKHISSIVLLVFITFTFYAPLAYAQDKADPQVKSVLITGASTGLGRHLAETLASSGHHVYAGARKQADLDALNAIDNITAVKLDVTKQDEIDAVVALIEQKGTGLYALVNNAGIGGGGPVATTPIEDQRLVYDINVEGVYRVTKAFAPMIIESEGRISTTGSIAGTITRAGMATYSGSKHWIEAFTDALAAEMAEHNVMISVIEPGNYQSYIRRSSVLRAYAKIEAAGGEITPEMQQAYENTASYELSLKQPDDVSAAFVHALFDEKPLRRYVVTPNQEEQAWTIGSKIQQLVELNQWGPHSYTRDQLVEMLDASLAEKAK
ncbi:SDR family NAD(P)-dependent oxidoreductase [Glaciecola sp. XM2]|jgi:NAD(P)-dependent dehydrogenase (short-subunit alcohol dehydrogenase family)|uniref:SDR family NAD(P)-dependent oxidoreductase n=1 Tax=Glaciecola sp. XM2 TaxID=1914931 RepID=UPI001BDEB09D|nr:SDR family NAD(P)-dependent oxidoreductase [Glaciecola sp. XM2]MBT1452055.1 SDR family NAD(P)-dependent oxidoreductase [Glaciecola sp. XM2]